MLSFGEPLRIFNPGEYPGRVLALLAALALAPLQPDLKTDPVSQDPDDPALWVNPADPSQSLIFGTDKEAAPNGGLYVFDLDGKTQQIVRPLDRPNNCDVGYGLPFNDGPGDFVVVTERLQRRLRLFRIDAKTRKLQDVSGRTRVFEQSQGEEAAPMGVAVFKNTVIVGRKTGPKDGYLAQYQLVPNAEGKVDLRFLRTFGAFRGGKEIESIATDVELGWVYFSDEGYGVHQYPADPGHPEAQREASTLATRPWGGDHEGIGLYGLPGGTGYVLATDQLPDASIWRFYRRDRLGGDRTRYLGEVVSSADETDGIEVSSANLGPKFPKGLVIAMSSKEKRFHLYRWERVEVALQKR